MIYVDFNDLDDEKGGISVLTSHSPTTLVPGETALLTDGTHSAQALIEDVVGDLAHLRIAWNTWGPLELLGPVSGWYKTATNSAAGRATLAEVFTSKGIAVTTKNVGTRTKSPA